MKLYEMFELQFQGEKLTETWARVDVRAKFIIEEEEINVLGFYAGDGIYKVRFYPRKVGLYRWKVTGVVNGAGEEYCELSTKSHGMVGVDGLHFKYEDGTRYSPFGTTIYALVHQEDELIDTTMATLKSSPFNKVRFCTFPKHYDYNLNEPEYFAFEKVEDKLDVHKPCFTFWDRFEERLMELGRLGIEADLILFHPYDRWGFSKLTKEECFVYLDYAIRRLSAYPNLWWSLANEYDLMPDFDYSWWFEFIEFIAKNDPYGHLRSNHNCFVYWDFDNEYTSHCCVQDICVNKVDEFQKMHKKPVVFDECCYEGNIVHGWGNISAFEMTHRFWTTVVNGGYCTHGETYMNEEQILWWSRGGQLVGESPKRISFLRALVESFPGPIHSMGDKVSFISYEHALAIKEGRIKEGDEGYFHFAKALSDMPRERIKEHTDRYKKTYGHCGDEIHIRYYGRECSTVGELFLPENGSYSVEVIDIWEMTSTVVMKDAKGKTTVKLPGKEGIAVLARRQKS